MNLTDEIKRLYCPFPTALNPATAAAHRHTGQWAKRFGLVSSANIERQVATEQFTWLAGRFFPWAPPRELELISDFTSWLFWHDDVCDETLLGEDPGALARRFEALVGTLTRRTHARPDDTFASALADLSERFKQASPSWGWFNRFVTSVQQYFEGGLWEARNRQRGAVPSWGDFVPMRRFAGGMYIYLDFIELANQTELPLVARGHAEVCRLAQMAASVACWHNDLFSLDKEIAYGEVHNLAIVLAHERRLDLEAASRMAVDHCNEEVASFIRSAESLPFFGEELSPTLAVYVKSLQSLMRGNLDWSLETQRYRGAFAPQNKTAAVPSPA